MIVELRRAPGTDALLGLKESLDFASGAWSGLFCRMGGATVLAQVGRGPGIAAAKVPNVAKGWPGLGVVGLWQLLIGAGAWLARGGSCCRCSGTLKRVGAVALPW
jgi:hypothetical protein